MLQWAFLIFWVTYRFPKWNVKQKISWNACMQINNLVQNFSHSIVACYDKTRCLRPSTTRLKANLFLCNKVRAFWNRKRKRKHWFIHFQISRHLILSIDCAQIFSARVSIVKNRTFGKGPSIYYVSIILDFFWPTHYVSINIVLNVSKTGYFLDSPTRSFLHT